MTVDVNPLCQPRPASEQRLYEGVFYFADTNARLAAGVFGKRLYLTHDFLWVTNELSIPIASIREARIFEAGWLPKRRALAITYENPVSSEAEAIFLCKPDPIGIGLYRRAPLEELLTRIQEARRSAHAPDPGVHVPGTRDSQAAYECEVCGRRPAYYVSYSHLISFMVLAHQSAARRRVHCGKHNLRHGAVHYVITSVTGWCGIGILLYPFAVYGAAQNLRPAVGRWAPVLGAIPTMLLAGLLAWHFLV